MAKGFSLSWNDVADIGKKCGWFTQLIRKGRVEFEKGRQKVVRRRYQAPQKRLAAEMLFLK